MRHFQGAQHLQLFFVAHLETTEQERMIHPVFQMDIQPHPHLFNTDTLFQLTH